MRENERESVCPRMQKCVLVGVRREMGIYRENATVAGCRYLVCEGYIYIEKGYM